MVSMGAMGDSYYEYLLKVWIYKGRRKEDDMYRGKPPLLEPAICELAGPHMRNKDKVGQALLLRVLHSRTAQDGPYTGIQYTTLACVKLDIGRVAHVLAVLLAADTVLCRIARDAGDPE